MLLSFYSSRCDLYSLEGDVLSVDFISSEEWGMEIISYRLSCLYGLREGDPLATNLFNFILEVVIEWSKIQTTGSIFHHKTQCITNADDMVLLTRSKRKLENVFSKFVEAKKVGL